MLISKCLCFEAGNYNILGKTRFSQSDTAYDLSSWFFFFPPFSPQFNIIFFLPKVMKISYSVLFARLFPFCFINSANFSINLGNDIHSAFFF